MLEFSGGIELSVFMRDQKGFFFALSVSDLTLPKNGKGCFVNFTGV